MTRRFAFAAAGALLASAAAFAPVPDLSAATLQVAQATRPPVEGEVTRVQKDTGKVTIRHGPIPNLDMPGMTMVFALKEPGMIDKVKAGSKITFTVDRIDGQFTVMSIDSIR